LKALRQFYDQAEKLDPRQAAERFRRLVFMAEQFYLVDHHSDFEGYAWPRRQRRRQEGVEERERWRRKSTRLP
jgi:hypothetical protein